MAAFDKKRVVYDDNSAGIFARSRGKRAFDVGDAPARSRYHRGAQRRCRCLRRTQIAIGERCSLGVEQQRNPGNRRRGLLQEPEPFAADRSFENGESGDTTAGVPQVLPEPRTDWIGHQHEDNRKTPVEHDGRGWCRATDHKIGPHCDAFVRSDTHWSKLGPRPAIVEFDIAAQFPADFLQTFLKGVNLCLSVGFAAVEPTHEYRDAPLLFALLRGCGERPCNGRTSNSFDEIASSHRLPQGLGPRQLRNYSRDFRLAEWGLTVILRGNNPQDPMSALGHKQTLRAIHTMSALPQKRTLVERVGMSALCQK